MAAQGLIAVAIAGDVHAQEGLVAPTGRRVSLELKVMRPANTQVEGTLVLLCPAPPSHLDAVATVVTIWSAREEIRGHEGQKRGAHLGVVMEVTRGEQNALRGIHLEIGAVLLKAIRAGDSTGLVLDELLAGGRIVDTSTVCLGLVAGCLKELWHTTVDAILLLGLIGIGPSVDKVRGMGALMDALVNMAVRAHFMLPHVIAVRGKPLDSVSRAIPDGAGNLTVVLSLSPVGVIGHKLGMVVLHAILFVKGRVVCAAVCALGLRECVGGHSDDIGTHGRGVHRSGYARCAQAHNQNLAVNLFGHLVSCWRIGLFRPSPVDASPFAFSVDLDIALAANVACRVGDVLDIPLRIAARVKLDALIGCIRLGLHGRSGCQASHCHAHCGSPRNESPPVDCLHANLLSKR